MVSQPTQTKAPDAVLPSPLFRQVRGKNGLRNFSGKPRDCVWISLNNPSNTI